MTLDNDLQARFESAHQAMDLDGGSSTEIKQLADRRTRNRQRVASALASAAVIAAIVGLGWLAFGLSADDPADTRVAAEPAPTANVSGADAAAVETPSDDASATDPVTEADFTYLGAFRLPIGDWTGSRFAYGGEAAAFHADGDPRSDDGFDGSLFMSGHPVRSPGVAEISIPAPARHDGSSDSLPVADVLQGFHDITDGRGSTQGGEEGNFRYSGLEVIETERGPRLAWTIWPNRNVTNRAVAGHGHSSLDIDEPDPEGPWFLGDYDSRATAGYLFAVDGAFADAHLDGHRLLTGLQDRRAGGDTSFGPPFFAFTAPDAAEPGLRTEVLPLAFYDGEPQAMDNFGRADTAGGAEWVSTSRGADAVVTVGLKGLGEVRNGSPGPDDCGNDKGRHAGPYEPQVLFYDPADLARAGAGDLELWQLEPYHRWNPAEHLIATCDWRLTSVSFDQQSGRLYIVQSEADTAQSQYSPVPVVHVFQL